MQYEGINTIESDGEEQQWLDVSYTARMYSQPKQATTVAKPKKRKLGKLIANPFVQIFALVFVAAAIMVGGMFISGDNDTVMGLAKTTFLNLFEADETPQRATITLPYNISIDSVDEGVITFSGGRIVVSFTDGTVSDVVDGKISVTLADDTIIVYSNMTECFVEKGDTVASYDVLGKYSDHATVSIFYQGQLIVDVIGSESQLQWSV